MPTATFCRANVVLDHARMALNIRTNRKAGFVQPGQRQGSLDDDRLKSVLHIPRYQPARCWLSSPRNSPDKQALVGVTRDMCTHASNGLCVTVSPERGWFKAFPEQTKHWAHPDDSRQALPDDRLCLEGASVYRRGALHALLNDVGVNPHTPLVPVLWWPLRGLR